MNTKADSTPDDQSQYESTTHPDMAKVLAAIVESRIFLTNQIDNVKVDIFLIKHDMQKLRDGVTETEMRIRVAEDAIAPIPQDVQEL